MIVSIAEYVHVDGEPIKIYNVYIAFWCDMLGCLLKAMIRLARYNELRIALLTESLIWIKHVAASALHQLGEGLLQCSARAIWSLL